MKHLSILVCLIASSAFFLIALAQQNDSATRRAYAQAAIIREQAQARQDLLAAMLPYVIFGSVIIIGLALAAVVIYALARQPQHPQQPMRIIEREVRIIVLQPDPGQTRREFYQSLGGRHAMSILPQRTDNSHR
jgi:ABC-type Fe3+ transport system permease subunit